MSAADTPSFRHETAIVESGATVGMGTKVWHHGHVRAGAVIGADTVLGKNVFVDAGARIGSRVKIQNNVSVYTGVTLEDDVFVGPSAVFTNDLRPRATGDWSVTPTLVCTGATIGANATVVCGVRVGASALVAAGAVVTRDVADHQLVVGNPARPRGWVCRCGAVVSRELEVPPDLRCEQCAASEVGVSDRSERVIPISSVDLGAVEERLVIDVLRSGRLAQGPMVQRLEERFAPLSGSHQVVAVANGTLALVAALQALGIGPGDEVITSPFTFVATLNAILEAGAVACFADIGDDFLLRPDDVAARVTDRTKAIMPVHLYGQCADMPVFAALAQDAGVALVEDAAQAHGATVDGRAAGSWGIGCFSLYATKNLTAGEGGLISTSDDELADTLRLLRNQGMHTRYQYERPGHNYRMTELQAAVAVGQLGRLAERTETRRRNAARLSEGLADIAGLELPVTHPERDHVWHQYTVRVTPAAGLDRDDLAKRLTARGITTGIYYPRLVHDYACYRGRADVRLDETPTASRMATEVLSLPVHPQLSEADLNRIVEATREALGC